MVGARRALMMVAKGGLDNERESGGGEDGELELERRPGPCGEADA